MLCACQLPAVVRPSRKEGDNFGKEFFSCQRNTCRFFQWVGANIPYSTIPSAQSSRPIDVPSKPGMVKVKLCFAHYDIDLNRFWFSVQK